MSVTLRYLVDENLPSGIAAALEEGGHDVLDLSHSRHRGESDEFVWHLAVYEDRVIIRRDLDLPLPHELGRPPGLVLIRAPLVPVAELEALSVSALKSLEPLTLRGSITVIEPGQIRQRFDSRPPTIPPPAR